MKYKFVSISFTLILLIMQFPTFSQVKIGVFADCQYCDCETEGTRFYRNSMHKLEESINQFNREKEIDFVVGLGDIIDRNFASFDSINKIISKSKKDVYQVIGNHDLEVEKALIEKVPSKLNLKKNWYSFTKKGWHFIFLNGNDITFHSNDADVVNQAKALTEKLKSEGKPNYHNWNGGIGKEQMQWLERELQQAENKNLKVAIFCHYPLLPFESHALWNSEELLATFEKFSCVKIYLNGHNHAGNYAIQNGIHFVNLKGMVETENENAFSIIHFNKNNIDIQGFERETSKNLAVD